MRSMPNIAPITSATQNDAGQNRRANGDQANAFEAEGDAHRPLLQFLRVRIDVAVPFEHALS